MSIKTTYCVQRELAICAITKALFEATNEQLSQMLETSLDDDRMNFSVLDAAEFEANRFDSYPIPYFVGIEDLGL